MCLHDFKSNYAVGADGRRPSEAFFAGCSGQCSFVEQESPAVSATDARTAPSFERWSQTYPGWWDR